MRFSLLSLPLLASVASALPTASETRDQSPTIYTTYYARAALAGTGISAHIEFWGTNDGSPTFVKMDVLGGLMPELSPTGTFIYHIHTNPIPADGNCTAALAHLDPLMVTESDTCDPAFPEYCQEGDLSGKHGAINGTASGIVPAFGYSDGYVRFFPAEFSLLGRSVVLHSTNKTRLACGNITSGIDGTADYYQMPTLMPSTVVTSYPEVAGTDPTTIITPFMGSVMPDNATIAALPRPLPMPALSLSDAVNVELTMTTFSTMVNNAMTTVTLPDNVMSSAAPPFIGYPSADWP